jgi:hypothetical protein
MRKFLMSYRSQYKFVVSIIEEDAVVSILSESIEKPIKEDDVVIIIELNDEFKDIEP